MTGWRAVAVWLVAASGIVAIVVSQVANPADLIVALIIGEVVVSFGVVGAVVVTHLPDNRVGWLLWGSGAVLGWATAGTAYATNSVASCGGCLPATLPIAVLTNMAFGPVVGVVAIFIPLLFPNGRLPSPRWRPVAWFGIVATVAFTISIAVTPGPMSGGIENPIGIDAAGAQNGAIQIVSLAGLCAAIVLALASVVWRFRHSGVVERQQLRWFEYAGVLMLAGLVVGLAWAVRCGMGRDVRGTRADAARDGRRHPPLSPVRPGPAGLADHRLCRRHGRAGPRLSRASTSRLTTAFSSIASGNPAVVAASTLVVAVLFTPLRRRVQHVVDRRFDRARYDSARTSAAFSDRLRDEIDLPVPA